MGSDPIFANGDECSVCFAKMGSDPIYTTVAENVLHGNAFRGIIGVCCGPNGVDAVAQRDHRERSGTQHDPLRSALDNVVDGNASPDLGTMLAATVK